VSDTIKFSYEGDPKHLAGILFGLLPTTSRPSVLPENPSVPGFEPSEPEPAPLLLRRPALVPAPEHAPDPEDDISSNPAAPPWIADMMSTEAQMQARPSFDFAKIPLDPEAWEVFVQVMKAWVVNFDGPLDEVGNPLTEQPDRLTLLKSLGEGRWPIFILRWAAHYTCLQKTVLAALSLGTTDADKDLADRISANIVQLSHAAFPDIAGFHDYSTRWRRS
jgi:hypothetical protein